MTLSLFHIENGLRDLLDGINDELTPEQTSLAIVNLYDALVAKTDQVAHFRESLVNYDLLLESKIKELKDRQLSINNKIEKFDEYVLNCMNIQQKDEFIGSFCKISKRKPVKAVEIFDETLVPIEFVRIPEVKPMIMKAEISKALKAGEIVDGARLVDGKISLQYKIK